MTFYERFFVGRTKGMMMLGITVVSPHCVCSACLRCTTSPSHGTTCHALGGAALA